MRDTRAAVGDSLAPLSYEQFCVAALRERRLVECLVPGFELVPPDPVHRAAEAVSLLKDAWVPTLVRRWGVIGALDPSQTEAPAECCEGIAFGKALMV